jgi:hypothetical protein
MRKLQRGIGVLLLAAGSLASVSCDEDGSDGGGDGGMSGGGFLDRLKEQCGFSCASKGIVEGNASISGYAPIDAFFGSVVNFNTVSAGASADIDAELNGIQTIFGISDAEAKANFVAAINAKLASRFNATVQVRSTPARCEVDARVAVKATVDCQARANCNATPPKASFECNGQCTVEANVSGGCDANAEVRCEVTAPDFQCNGSCDGACRVNIEGGASCTGTCNGTCNGTCEGNTNTGGGCTGKCTGTCSGSCESNLSAEATCTGTCSGTCRYKPATAMCDAKAKVSCDLKAEAKAECTGSCSGEFEPPKVMCEAAASCEASAKAEAKFQVVCTPPSIDVRLIAVGGGELSADARFAITQLQLALPRLSASVARADTVDQAGNELTADGQAAVTATVRAVGSLDPTTTYRVASCVPAQLNAATSATATASAQLRAKIAAARSVASAFGMVM